MHIGFSSSPISLIRKETKAQQQQHNSSRSGACDMINKSLIPRNRLLPIASGRARSSVGSVLTQACCHPTCAPPLPHLCTTTAEYKLPRTPMLIRMTEQAPCNSTARPNSNATVTGRSQSSQGMQTRNFLHGMNISLVTMWCIWCIWLVTCSASGV